MNPPLFKSLFSSHTHLTYLWLPFSSKSSRPFPHVAQHNEFVRWGPASPRLPNDAETTSAEAEGNPSSTLGRLEGLPLSSFSSGSRGESIPAESELWQILLLLFLEDQILQFPLSQILQFPWRPRGTLFGPGWDGSGFWITWSLRPRCSSNSRGRFWLRLNWKNNPVSNILWKSGHWFSIDYDRYLHPHLKCVSLTWFFPVSLGPW